MFNEEEIHEIVKRKIEADEKLGEQTGGSSHLSYVSYVLNNVKTKQLSDEKIEIQYKYKIFIESEFTVYPDNPPMEYPKTKVIVVDKNKKIISDNENE